MKYHNDFLGSKTSTMMEYSGDKIGQILTYFLTVGKYVINRFWWQVWSSSVIVTNIRSAVEIMRFYCLNNDKNVNYNNI